MTRRLLYAAVVTAIVALIAFIWLRSRATTAAPSPAPAAASPDAPGQRSVAYWWDPMLGPSSIANHPGKSAMGMDLVPVYSDTLSSGSGVRIDPAVVQNMGVTTAPVTRGPLHFTVRAFGMLQVPEPAMHDVTARVGGYVVRLYADTNGQHVQKGDVLLDLYSPDLQVAQQELIAAEQSMRRLGAGAGGSTRQEAQSLIESTRRKLSLWNIADQDIDAIAAADLPQPTVPLRSDADGHVVEKSVVQGSAVQPGMKIMRIEDHSRLWLDAQVYENQLSLVAVGQPILASIDALPGATLQGNISFIYPHLDHMDRTALVRTVLNNPGHVLRPGMFATVRIVTQPDDNAVLIPRVAVIDTGTRQFVFLADPDSPGHFEPRDVQVGLTGDDDRVQVLRGVAPGDQVVTSGQFLMDVESRTNEAIQKLRGASAN